MVNMYASCFNWMVNNWGQRGTFGPGLPLTKGSNFRNSSLSPNECIQRVRDVLTGLKPHGIHLIPLNLGPLLDHTALQSTTR